jgi:hypothetical protein
MLNYEAAKLMGKSYPENGDFSNLICFKYCWDFKTLTIEAIVIIEISSYGHWC